MRRTGSGTYHASSGWSGDGVQRLTSALSQGASRSASGRPHPATSFRPLPFQIRFNLSPDSTAADRNGTRFSHASSIGLRGCVHPPPGDERQGRRAGGVRHRRPHQLRPYRRGTGGRGIPALLGRPDSRPDVAAHRVRAVARYPDGNQRSGDPPGAVDAHPGVAAPVPGAGRVLAVRPRRRAGGMRSGSKRWSATRPSCRRPFGTSAGTRASARSSGWASMPACTATIAIPSWTSAATMTTMATVAIIGGGLVGRLLPGLPRFDVDGGPDDRTSETPAAGRFRRLSSSAILLPR